jgi:hypothetical protein
VFGQILDPVQDLPIRARGRRTGVEHSTPGAGWGMGFVGDDRLCRIGSWQDYDEAMPISAEETTAYVDRVTRKVQAGEDW